ncbi:outer membrane beta-barrel protein [Coraliomargarita parva]|uniref:outer membrane beta-barrel protein n=1 Tax=Coraliomargarita parva TaxID=3014050 RepID=UPI0022B330EB|nr:outer membrane beta-barrel protein [Coraliomargarita parva]
MKNKIVFASALLGAASFATAEIVVNDVLSFEGFVDMSYSHADADLKAYGEESDNSFAIDQVEISWLFNFEPVTARVDLQYEEAGSEMTVDQAFVVYDLGNGLAVSAGRIDSMLGFEAFEPTGLYQYSFAYALPVSIPTYGDNLADASLLPGTNHAVRLTYGNDLVLLAASLQDGVYNGDNRLGGSGEDSNCGVELAASFNLGNGLTYFIGGAYEDVDASDSDSWIVNSYLAYETGAWVFALELNYGESDDDIYGIDSGEVDHFSGLVMANFAYSEQGAVTGRLSYVDVDSFYANFHFYKASLAHNWAFTDNLLLVAELSYVDGNYHDVDMYPYDFKELSAALELLFSF